MSDRYDPMDEVLASLSRIEGLLEPVTINELHQHVYDTVVLWEYTGISYHGDGSGGYFTHMIATKVMCSQCGDIKKLEVQ